MIKKIKVKSPANIAFIKYWGQRDKKLILPYNDSFSMNLSNCYTEVKMEILEDEGIKELYIKDYQKTSFEKNEGEALEKVKKFFGIAEKFLKKKIKFGFRIYSLNSFPKKAGIASSASFFSAIALAITNALEMERKISQKNLSILARLSGSGSACRSIPDGFVWWQKGKESSDSFAYSIAPASFWKIFDMVLILSTDEKKISSFEGHQKVLTSPFFKLRLTDLRKRIKMIRRAFLKKDFTLFGNLVEEEALSMHFVMMTQKPPLFYWSGKTIELMKEVLTLRKNGVEVYFTLDAGENLHLIYQKKDELKVKKYFKSHPLVIDLINNSPSIGARFI